ncbi:hypothetical protein [Caldivirga maquilingensis]|uniref:Uncharacterized protein n=1 Tax=Caldivirga maquilingensis (strain ATCC 700844 / DSM 13496 / JCM 10307 / IC-167) TaxID=397948 RepID=A8MAZ9_CALMQ|nr:hypothetical protein [Caldivirga maquilingensis]ABW02628.1 hypothetical protein Cmaq_1810 [Caldivirga maquilingensis IC-167]
MNQAPGSVGFDELYELLVRTRWTYYDGKSKMLYFYNNVEFVRSVLERLSIKHLVDEKGHRVIVWGMSIADFVIKVVNTAMAMLINVPYNPDLMPKYIEAIMSQRPTVLQAPYTH